MSAPASDEKRVSKVPAEKATSKRVTAAVREVTLSVGRVIHLHRMPDGAISIPPTEDFQALLNDVRLAHQNGEQNEITVGAAAEELGKKHAEEFASPANGNVAQAWGLDVSDLFRRAVKNLTWGKFTTATMGKIQTPHGLIYTRKGDGPTTKYIIDDALFEHFIQRQKDGQCSSIQELGIYIRTLGIHTITSQNMWDRLKDYKEKKYGLKDVRPAFDRKEGIHIHVIPGRKRNRNKIYIQDVASNALALLWFTWMINEAKAIARANPSMTDDEVAAKLVKVWGLSEKGLKISAAEVRQNIKQSYGVVGVRKLKNKTVGGIWIVERKEANQRSRKRVVSTEAIRKRIVTLYEDAEKEGIDINAHHIDRMAVRLTNEWGLEAHGASISARFVIDQLKRMKKLTEEDVLDLRKGDEDKIVTTLGVTFADPMERLKRIALSLSVNQHSSAYADAIKSLAALGGEDQAIVLSLTNGQHHEHQKNLDMHRRGLMARMRLTQAVGFTTNPWGRENNFS